jgi:hypothetical protein
VSRAAFAATSGLAVHFRIHAFIPLCRPAATIPLEVQ